METHTKFGMLFLLITVLASETQCMVDLRRQREISVQSGVPTNQVSPIQSLPQSQNETSPMVFFELTKPIELANEKPCSLQLLEHDFGNTYGQPPVLVKYKPPTRCPTKWSKVVMEWKATCKGKQFDRIAGVWLSGVEILRTCTAEPTKTGIEWSILKDITKYTAMLRNPQVLEVKLDNLLDKTYTGIFHVNISFHFYGEGKRAAVSDDVGYGHADWIMPISLPSSVTGGAWFQVQNESDVKSVSLSVPRNTYRAVMEVFVSYHSDDEFWYTNPPNVYIEANNLTGMAGNGAFREVVAYVDDLVVGTVWPFPVVYTGGINPLFWRPVSGIGSFDLPSYEIEITPFLGRLLDGEKHKFSLSVTNALSVWFVDANLYLWVDKEITRTSAKLTEYEVSPLKVDLVSNFKGLDGSFDTSTGRKISYSGWVESSRGRITTHTSQAFEFVNSLKLENNASIKIVHQQIRSEVGVILEEPEGIVLSAQFHTDFPLYLYFAELDKGNNTSVETANFSNGFNMDISIVAPKDSFFSSLHNNQNAEGYIVVQNNLVSTGLGSTQQTYKYGSTEGCYSRTVSVSNYTFLSDHTDNFCGDIA